MTGILAIDLLKIPCRYVVVQTWQSAPFVRGALSKTAEALVVSWHC